MTAAADNTTDILLFAEDPGGANFVMHLPDAAQELSLRCRLYVAGSALGYLKERGIAATVLAEGDDIGSLLSQLSPRAVVVGTSVNRDTAALTLIDAAKDRSIPSVGVVDAVMSAKLRFRGRSEDPLHHQPDWLLVPDEVTAKQYEGIGFRAARILVCGHPHHDHVRKRRAEFDRLGRRGVRASALPELDAEAKVVLFAAEPPIPQESWTPPTGSLTGWRDTTERTHVALQELIDCLRKLSFETHLILRLHARNNPDDFTRYAGHVDLVSQAGDPLALVYASDAVIGLTSSLVAEAVLLGTPAVSVVSTEADFSELPHALMSSVSRVRSPGQLRTALLDALGDRNRVPLEYECSSGNQLCSAISRIIGERPPATK